MKFVIQRVNSAEVAVGGETIGRIGKGLLVFVGVEEDDTRETADKMVRKLAGLRIFADDEGKTNLSIRDVGGRLLVVSQFTLCADCRKGNRPSFVHAGDPAKADEMYEYILSGCEKAVPGTEHGSFGADMQVSLVNDGPFTIVLESRDLM